MATYNIGNTPTLVVEATLASKKRTSNTTMSYTFNFRSRLATSDSFLGKQVSIWVDVSVAGGSSKRVYLKRSSSANWSGTTWHTASSATVTCKSTAANQSQTAKFVFNCAEASSYKGTKTMTVTSSALLWTNVVAPTSFNVYPEPVQSDGTVTIEWSGASNGNNNNITAYNVLYGYNKTVSETNYDYKQSVVTTTGMTSGKIDIPLPQKYVGTGENYWNFKLEVIGQHNTVYSSGDSIFINVIPTEPIGNTIPNNINNQISLPSNGGEVSFNITRGIDIDTSQNLSLYLSINNGEKQFLSNTDITKNYIINENSTYSFYTFDGLEYSNPLTYNIKINQKPVINNNNFIYQSVNVYNPREEVNYINSFINSNTNSAFNYTIDESHLNSLKNLYIYYKLSQDDSWKILNIYNYMPINLNINNVIKTIGYDKDFYIGYRIEDSYEVSDIFTDNKIYRIPSFLNSLNIMRNNNDNIIGTLYESYFFNNLSSVINYTSESYNEKRVLDRIYGFLKYGDGSSYDFILKEIFINNLDDNYSENIIFDDLDNIINNNMSCNLGIRLVDNTNNYIEKEDIIIYTKVYPLNNNTSYIMTNNDYTQINNGIIPENTFKINKDINITNGALTEDYDNNQVLLTGNLLLKYIDTEGYENWISIREGLSYNDLLNDSFTITYDEYKDILLPLLNINNKQYNDIFKIEIELQIKDLLNQQTSLYTSLYFNFKEAPKWNNNYLISEVVYSNGNTNTEYKNTNDVSTWNKENYEAAMLIDGDTLNITIPNTFTDVNDDILSIILEEFYLSEDQYNNKESLDLLTPNYIYTKNIDDLTFTKNINKINNNKCYIIYRCKLIDSTGLESEYIISDLNYLYMPFYKSNIDILNLEENEDKLNIQLYFNSYGDTLYSSYSNIDRSISYGNFDRKAEVTFNFIRTNSITLEKTEYQYVHTIALQNNNFKDIDQLSTITNIQFKDASDETNYKTISVTATVKFFVDIKNTIISNISNEIDYIIMPPLLAYRLRQLGLNTKDVLENELFAIHNGDDIKKDITINYTSSDNTINHKIVLNSDTGKIEGIIIDCGNW